MIQTCKIVHFQRGNEKISPLWSSTMKRLSITWNIDLYCVPGQCFFHIIFILVDFNVGNLLLVWFFSKKCCSPVRNFVTRHWLGPGGRRNLMEDMSKLPTRDFDQFWKREQQAWCAWLFGGVRMLDFFFLPSWPKWRDFGHLWPKSRHFGHDGRKKKSSMRVSQSAAKQWQILLIFCVFSRRVIEAFGLDFLISNLRILSIWSSELSKNAVIQYLKASRTGADRLNNWLKM